MDGWIIFLLVFSGVLGLFLPFFKHFTSYRWKQHRAKEKRIAAQRQRAVYARQRITELADTTGEVTPQEFFEIRRNSYAYNSQRDNTAGVYILFNKSKNLHYVGQGQRVFSRVNDHFTGKGNGDVYADYKYGDVFSIKMIKLQGSGYMSLDELERDTITKYNAYSNGYNKTRGNR